MAGGMVDNKVAVDRKEGGVGGKTSPEEVGNPPPSTVTFPDAARRWKQSFPSPLKLENEDADDGMTNPRNMWQVYALGGFLLVRWLWARWRERKDRGKSNEDPSA